MKASFSHRRRRGLRRVSACALTLRRAARPSRALMGACAGLVKEFRGRIIRTGYPYHGSIGDGAISSRGGIARSSDICRSEISAIALPMPRPGLSAQADLTRAIDFFFIFFVFIYVSAGQNLRWERWRSQTSFHSALLNSRGETARACAIPSGSGSAISPCFWDHGSGLSQKKPVRECPNRSPSRPITVMQRQAEDREGRIIDLVGVERSSSPRCPSGFSPMSPSPRHAYPRRCTRVRVSSARVTGLALHPASARSCI